MEPQKTKRISLPSDFTSSMSQLAGERIIEFILERTAKSIAIDGSHFPNYSTSYAESKDFKNAGKSKSHPDLHLTGEMLAELSVLQAGQGYVTIGFQAGTPANDKAVWAERSDNGPARMFLGITDANLAPIVDSVRVDALPSNKQVQSLAQSILRGLFR